MRLPHGSLWRVRKHLNAHLCSPQMSRQYFWSMQMCGMNQVESETLFILSRGQNTSSLFYALASLLKINIKNIFQQRTTVEQCDKIIDDLILSIIFIPNVMIVLPLKANPDLPEIASDDRRMNVSLPCCYHSTNIHIFWRPGRHTF